FASACTISSISANRPAPTSPSASKPTPGPTVRNRESAWRAPRFSWVIRFSYIATFIEGASNTGPRKASKDVVTASLAIPDQIRSRWRDDVQIGPARQMQVTEQPLLSRIKVIRQDGIAG